MQQALKSSLQFILQASQAHQHLKDANPMQSLTVSWTLSCYCALGVHGVSLYDCCYKGLLFSEGTGVVCPRHRSLVGSVQVNLVCENCLSNRPFVSQSSSP